MDKMHPFLRTIAENPDDDNPRLVFSDWLEENGHQDRAEFIRLQIELANMDPSEDGYAEKTARMYRTGVFTNKATMPFLDHVPNSKCKIGFERGFIAALIPNEMSDKSGFDLLPVQSLVVVSNLADKFKGFKKLKWLELAAAPEYTPDKLLEILGPNGWFQHLETLSLPHLDQACLQAGVIPQFELPKLRNLYLSSDFHTLGESDESNSSPDEDEFSLPEWVGWPENLVANAIPNPKCPLERFVWQSDIDTDSYHDGDFFWPTPTMETFLERLKVHKLKQFEVAADYDDHENGGEGVMAAPYEQNPLELVPSLERVTVKGNNLRLLEDSKRKLKMLRVYDRRFYGDSLFSLLSHPVCSELEELHLEERSSWGSGPSGKLNNHFPHLKSLFLSGNLLENFTTCPFPKLLSLWGGNLKTVLSRKWPCLQQLAVGIHKPEDLKVLVDSDCFPNLTTLIFWGYFGEGKPDFSFLAKCKHMPFLSRVQIRDYPNQPYLQEFIINNGKLLPVRGDIMMDKLSPTTPFRVMVTF